MHQHAGTPPSSAEGRARLEVADIFRAHGEEFRQRHVLTRDQLDVMRCIETCRTAVLGGHLDVCDTCNYSAPSYNSCRNRHCPKCQALTAAKWVEERMERILPTHYFHGVFTLPAPLRSLCLRNPKQLHDLLFDSSSQTLLQLGRDPDRLGAQLGITSVLHTWTRKLEYHPHVHAIVTGGGLSKDGERWIPTTAGYLFPVQVLSALFRSKFLDGLRRLHADGELDIGGPCSELALPSAFQKLLDQLYHRDWIVYAKRPFAGPEQVFKYLSRYTHRTGLSNNRLVSFDDRGVCFRTKDGKTVVVESEEFIRRFLLHVLPSGYVKIRHFGLMASGNVKTKLVIAQKLLHKANPALSSEMSSSPAMPPTPSPCETLEGTPPVVPHTVATPVAADTTTKDIAASISVQKDWRDRVRELTGVDLFTCPSCRRGKMLRLSLPSPGNMPALASAPPMPSMDTS